jgi:hypothetical protein
MRSRVTDDEMLVTICGFNRNPGISRLSVDDFHDEDEAEISSEEIHVTLLHREQPIPPCFRLSVTSAKLLIQELQKAVDEREGKDLEPFQSPTGEST